MNHSEQPFFSIVIPCRNEERYIGACIRSVIGNGYPQDRYEIWVVDGMSTDRTPDIVKGLIQESSRVYFLQNHLQYTPAGLNLGIRRAGGEVIMILGGHAVLQKGYLQRCEALLAQFPDVACVGGIIENVHGDENSEAIGMAMSSPFGVGNSRFRTGGKAGFVDTVAFGAYRREVFDRCGFFDEDLVRNQDDEFNYRLQLQGMKIYFSPELQSDYYVRTSFLYLWKQFYQYGYWKVYVNRKHKKVTSLRQLVPLGFVLYLLAVFPVLLAGSGLIWVWAAGIFVYTAISALSAVKAAGITSRAFGVMYAFLAMHLAYGIGYLEGILQFVILGLPPAGKKMRITR